MFDNIELKSFSDTIPINDITSFLRGAIGSIMAIIYAEYNYVNKDWFKCLLINF